MRVSLPVDPQNKTRGEVTTLEFLRRETDVPVPSVVAFDDSADNEIGFEWILMELIPGVSLYKKWRSLTAFQKAAIVQRMADFQAQIFRHRFYGLGTLTASKEKNCERPRPGRLVSTAFFAGKHFDIKIPRGPFHSTHDWLYSYLEIVLADNTAAKTDAEDEEDEEDAEFALGLTYKLIYLLPKIFPSLRNCPERSVIWHQDLSLSNILVNEHGDITGVIDWECVSAMPLWMASQIPEFLEDQTRDEEPQPSNYADASETGPSHVAGRYGDELDNEGKNELYWIHLMEYEITQLRRLYERTMHQTHPELELQVEDTALKQDFAEAVFRCGDGIFLKGIMKWVEAVERGEFPRLQDILQRSLRV